jgi:hypothetical protein
MSILINTMSIWGNDNTLLIGHTTFNHAMVAETIRVAAQESEVVVLAQASMARLVPQLGDLAVPVLSSPHGGVEEL